MAPRGFRQAGRGRRQIKGSIGGGGGKGNLSRKVPVGTPPPTGGTTTPPSGTTTTVPDFTKNPLTPWDSNTPIGQLFNQGLYKFPTQNKAVTGLDPRVKMVAGDSTRERIQSVNRILAAQRVATSPMDPRIKATGVVGDSGRERVATYNRIASGRSVFQRQNQIARMAGTQRGSAVAKAGSAALRSGAAQTRAAAPARTSSAGSAPRAAAPRSAAPRGAAKPSSKASVAAKAPTPVKKRSTTAMRAK